MICVEECTRSTLYLNTDNGMLSRRYHDTDRWSPPFPPIFDDRGHARCSGNRRIDLLMESERTYGGTRTVRRIPPYLTNSLRVLCKQHSPNIEAVARELDVKTSTAWSYVYKVVETWPQAHKEASRIVHPEILNAVSTCVDISGTLKELYQCIHREIGAAREVYDLFAHIRLARVCTQASHTLRSK